MTTKELICMTHGHELKGGIVGGRKCAGPRGLKGRILEAARDKDTVTYKGIPIRLSADFSKETLQARRDWQEVFKVLKGKDLHPRLLYPAKLSFRMEGQIKCFSE